MTRKEFREKLAERLEKVVGVYDAALDDPDARVSLTAAKQISVELWGNPTQPVSGDGGGPVQTNLTVSFVKPDAAGQREG